MITNKLKYALKALIALAEEQSGQNKALRIEDIAKRGAIPKRFLEHILLDIRNAGFIESLRGRSGGYVLSKSPRDVPFSELVRLIDGPLAPLPCLSRRSYQRCEDCKDEKTCSIRRVFSDVFWSYLLLIESLTLNDFLTGEMSVEQIISLKAPF
jgi:Rrf2 family protein